MDHINNWERFKKNFFPYDVLGLSLDISRMNYPDNFFKNMENKMFNALNKMEALESGGIANPDEGRMVGHYWLREPNLAPNLDIKREIEETLLKIKKFSKGIHNGTILSSTGQRFDRFLLIGIGGSALGPQLIAEALGMKKDDKMLPYFIDNTDPDGFDIVLNQLDKKLSTTLILVISKSGGTKETSNAMMEVKEVFIRNGLKFSKHAVAVTQKDSKLAKIAETEGWLDSFPMWDWVGGRTSVTSAVGLLPAALLGIDIESFLKGARYCDRQTRLKDIADNPAALLSLMWYYGSNGKGQRDMVIIPYKDRLSLLSKYLQQLVMESLGKEKDLDGNIVHQGLTVYGNKGSTDQHAYIQQLVQGVNNFFATFIEVLEDREGKGFYVEDNVTSGDYLSGFLLGTRDALTENGRESITITIPRLDTFAMGIIIALYERAVGLYGYLINVNAYNQPGVEGGKNAADRIIYIQRQIKKIMEKDRGKSFTIDQLAKVLNIEGEREKVFKILEHLTANKIHNICKVWGKDCFSAKYYIPKE